MAKVLVIGGAGYVGSSVTAYLMDQGHEPWVLDDLSTGFRSFVLSSKWSHFQVGDQDQLRKLLSENKFDCVMHFAARSLVGESVHKRNEYFENNVYQTERLLEVLIESGHPGHRRFIFSSTCAIYGTSPDGQALGPIDESFAKKPINPYGESKLAAERLLERYAHEKGLQAIALRYFNAAGADPKLRTGEWHHPETHLLPRVLKSCLEGTPIEIYGTDYPSEDGTCVRDYIHVWDLARAHEAAMKRMIQSGMPGRFEAYNLGSENGFSVREVIEGCFMVTGKETSVVEKPRRAGDAPVLVADSMLARKMLGFQTAYSLEDIIRDAFNWEQKKKEMPRRAVFLDRDGTLNEDPGYLNNPDLLKLFPNVGKSLARLKDAGFLLVVTSNQSGVGRGLIDANVLPVIHERLNTMLRPDCGVIDHFELCIHHPNSGCECRKPKPKLLTDAALELGVDVKRSYMVGDKLTDVECGRAALCQGTVMVRTGEGKDAEHSLKPGQVDFVGDSLTEAVDWILGQENVAH
jgi:UDP-glucose-4-epimerase GalE